MPINTYRQVVQALEKNLEIANVPESELDQWQKILDTARQNTTDQEDLAVKTVYYLLFLLKTKRSSLKTIKDYYHKIRNYLHNEELRYQQKLAVVGTKEERNLLNNQLLSFYRLAEYYTSYIEESFYVLGLKELKNEAYLDKLKWLQRHKLAEKKIFHYFSYARLYFSHKLKRHPFTYAAIGFLGIILLWQGSWGAIEWGVSTFKLEHYLWPYLLNALIGALILCTIGRFLSETVGIEEDLSQAANEIRKLESFVRRDPGRRK